MNPKRTGPKEVSADNNFREAELSISNHASVAVFMPRTERAEAWLREHAVSGSWQWLGRALVVDRRFAPGLAERAKAEGLMASREGRR